MNFYMIIGRNAFYLYRRANNGFEIEYIDGNSYRHYDTHSIKTDLANLLETVADVNNLSGTDEIFFTVIQNADPIRNKNVEQVLGSRIKEKFSVDEILIRAVKSLAQDKNLHIGKFGITYDGTSYIFKDGKLEKIPYSLLAYNFGQEKLIEYV